MALSLRRIKSDRITHVLHRTPVVERLITCEKMGRSRSCDRRSNIESWARTPEALNPTSAAVFHYMLTRCMSSLPIVNCAFMVSKLLGASSILSPSVQEVVVFHIPGHMNYRCHCARMVVSNEQKAFLLHQCPIIQLHQQERNKGTRCALPKGLPKLTRSRALLLPQSWPEAQLK